MTDSYYINKLLEMESDKCKAFRQFNKMALELGEITSQQYLDEEKRIMTESIENMKQIISKNISGV